MENTCNTGCKLWKKYKESCPNYMETFWKKDEKAESILIKDCAPKRTFLMIQELYSRLIGVQQAEEEQRDASNKVMGVVQTITTQLAARMIAQDPNVIELLPEQAGG